MKEKRKVELVVISDVHLGTFGCHAKELLHYLKSIDPQHLVLNGDIIDVWQFSKKYFPTAHMKVIRYLMKLIQKGTRVTYITGNHDEAFRRFVGFEMGGFELKNKLLLLFLIFQSLKISSMHFKTMKFLSLMLGHRICDLKASFFKNQHVFPRFRKC